MKPQHPPTTAICTSSADAIHVRGASLVDELIGRLSFTEMILFHLLGERPSRTQTVLLDAVTAYMNLLRDSAILDLQKRNVEVIQEQLRQTRDRRNR